MLRWNLSLLTGSLMIQSAFAFTPVDGVTDPFAFFLAEPLPLPVSHTLNQSGYVEWGAGVTSDDNVHFGRDSGRDDDGLDVVISLDLQLWEPDDDGAAYWGVRARDIGLDNNAASVWWGRVRDYRVQIDYQQSAWFDAKHLVTPFRGIGSSFLWLPADWVAGSTTGAMANLDEALLSYDEETERDSLGLRFRKRFDERWSLDASAHRDNKSGIETAGAAFYLDASNGHAVILPLPVDSTTDALKVAANYGGDGGSMQLGYSYSRFDDHENYLRWENPYSGNAGAGFDYPDGVGSLGQAPDNQAQQLRVTGHYQLQPSLLAQVDVAYQHATQDQSFEPYSVNPAATIIKGLPRDSLDGEVNTTTLNAALISTAIDRLTVHARYRYEDRDNQTPRDGYLYVRGDSGVQPAAAFTVYNRPTSTTRNTLHLEGTYRLPSSARWSLGYQYEEISRYNMAVNRTREDRLDTTLKITLHENVFGRLYVAWLDRAASTYRWDQSYYALLDPALINATPETQRYNNHPLLSQYFLANRERLQTTINLNWVQSAQWQHNLDVAWTADDYDESELGLLEEHHLNTTLSSSFMPVAPLVMTAYYSLDSYDASQRGRTFNGGLEKNAFVTVAPFPQASDPQRDWEAEPRDTVHSLGINIDWAVRKDLIETELDYRFTATRSEQSLTTFGAEDLLGVDLPDNSSRLHHVNAVAQWHARRDLTIKFNYQYYRYRETTWSNEGVLVDTLDKVLGAGDTDSNETVNFLGLSLRLYLP